MLSDQSRTLKHDNTTHNAISLKQANFFLFGHTRDLRTFSEVNFFSICILSLLLFYRRLRREYIRCINTMLLFYSHRHYLSKQVLPYQIGFTLVNRFFVNAPRISLIISIHFQRNSRNQLKRLDGFIPSLLVIWFQLEKQNHAFFLQHMLCS